MGVPHQSVTSQEPVTSQAILRKWRFVEDVHNARLIAAIDAVDPALRQRPKRPTLPELDGISLPFEPSRAKAESELLIHIRPAGVRFRLARARGVVVRLQRGGERFTWLAVDRKSEFHDPPDVTVPAHQTDWR